LTQYVLYRTLEHLSDAFTVLLDTLPDELITMMTIKIMNYYDYFICLLTGQLKQHNLMQCFITDGVILHALSLYLAIVNNQPDGQIIILMEWTALLYQ
jgi:hypothetical protein